MTIAEREFVEQQAALAGLDVTEYVRRRILGHVVAPAPAQRRADPALITEVNRLGLELKAIGNNANQLALSTHTGRRFRASWEAVVDRINALGGEVSEALERLVISDP